MIRGEYFAGSFYPASKNEILSMFLEFNSKLDDSLQNPEILQKNPTAVIVPHAGYVYSGINANIAYRAIKKESNKFFIIGPSHHYAFEGVSVGEFLEYATPLGVLQSDEELIKELNQPFIPQAHKEHSTEVQFPFIKYHFPEAKIVEAVYGRVDFLQITKLIISAIHLGYKIIISTDLSHFYTLQEAKKKDNICMHAIKTLDINALNSGCEACGKIGVEGMIIAARELNLTPELLFYSTSADANNDENRVVGYLSAQFV